MKKRKCQGCKELKDADSMYKITKEYKSNDIYFNPNSKILGRSAYVCKNNNCIKLMLKKKTLKNALKINDSSKIECILLNIIKGQ